MVVTAKCACLRSVPPTPAGLTRAVQQRRARVPFTSRPAHRQRAAITAMAGGPFEKLADMLGDEVYADLNGWRLYLRDMKADGGKTMAQVLAEKVGAGEGVEAAMGAISISLGGGKREIKLVDVVPTSQITNATRSVEDLND